MSYFTQPIPVDCQEHTLRLAWEWIMVDFVITYPKEVTMQNIADVFRSLKSEKPHLNSTALQFLDSQVISMLTAQQRLID